MKDEFNQPVEFYTTAEYHEDVKEIFESKPVEKRKKRSSFGKLRKMVYLVSAVLTVTVLSNAVDPEFSILGGIGMSGEERESGSGTEEETKEQNPNTKPTVKPSEDAVVTFPKLSNLRPNGAVPGYGVLDEEYVYFLKNGETQYLYAGAKFDVDMARVTGASYDFATNTLTLRNVTADQLNVNMMGNGFTIVLEGDNNIKEVLIWGFMYGGSVTFTGSGTLTMTGDAVSGVGLVLESENSESCIMVDSGVKLDISGNSMAILVKETTEKKALYIKNPLKLTGGEWKAIDKGNGNTTYSAVDKSGELVKHVIIE